MGYFEALCYGIIQGLTEFLPVSSSGHLRIAHLLGLAAGLPRELELAFDVLLHLASLLAITIAFRRELMALRDAGGRFWLGFVLAAIPAGVVGFCCEGLIDTAARRWWVVGCAFVWTALLLTVAWAVVRQSRGAQQDVDAGSAGANPAGPKAGIAVGLLQATALVPGVSRSGATIAGGLFAGLAPGAAVAFAFIVGLPLIAGACLKKTTDGKFGELIATVGWGPLVVGFATCLAVSLASIAALRLVVTRNHLQWFALYCGLLAAACFVLESVSGRAA